MIDAIDQPREGIAPVLEDHIVLQNMIEVDVQPANIDREWRSARYSSDQKSA